MENVKLTKKFVMIVDTQTGTHKEGAKGQDLFHSAGEAKRSLVHSGWWSAYKQDQLLIKIGRKDLLDEKTKIEAERRRCFETGAPISSSLDKALEDVEREIRKAKDLYCTSHWPNEGRYTQRNNLINLVDDVRFNNQTRFKLKKVVAIQVEDL